MLNDSLWLMPRRKINRMRNVPGFIRLWDEGKPDDRHWRYRLRRSSSGNINSTGSIGGLSAPALAHWHPQFEAGLEDGVRALVLALVCGGRWISYTSCAGHHYGDLPLQNAERHVGLLPRSEAERDVLAAALVKIVKADQSNASDVARAGLVSTWLDDRGRNWPTIELYIAKNPERTWDEYFSEVDRETNRIVDNALDAFGNVNG